MSSTPKQGTLEDFTAGTTTETLTRTVRCRLETSAKKNERLAAAQREVAAMQAYMSDMLASVPPHKQHPQNTTLYRMVVGKFDDRTVSAKVAQCAKNRVIEAMDSWRERGCPGNRPRFDAASNARVRVTNQELTLVQNDRGFGVKVNFIPYNPTWWHLNIGQYQRELLSDVVDGESRLGSAELHTDGESAYIHLVVNTPVEVYQPDGVSRWLGVDIGENTLWAAALVDGAGDVDHVTVKSGREFRHYRERLEAKKDELQAKGDLRGVKQTRGDRERYTEHILDTASKQIVGLAADHAPAGIALEDLTHYRSTARDPIHDWPFALLQEKIAYKATRSGIPVRKVASRNTSITCRQCGQSNPEYRDGAEFHCTRCGYEVHADVNAAINIANRA